MSQQAKVSDSGKLKLSSRGKLFPVMETSFHYRKVLVSA